MRIKLFASLRLPGTGGHVDVTVGPNARVIDALEALFQQVPDLRPMILQPDMRELLPFVNVMVNGRLARDLQGLDTPVTDEDVLAIFPPVAGG